MLMEAIRQFVKVKNRQINIVLPEGFDAEEVEVIVLSTLPDFELSQEQKAIIEERFNEPEDSYMTSKQSLEIIKKKYGF